MIADIVTIVHLPLEQAAIGNGVFADYKERCGDVILLQNRQDLWRPHPIGSIIESQGYAPGLGARALHDERGW
jgi:hypothetical protein